MMKVYNVTVEGYAIEDERKDIRSFLMGYVWDEIECTEQNILSGKFIDTYKGVSAYYDFVGDYYYFVDEIKHIYINGEFIAKICEDDINNFIVTELWQYVDNKNLNDDIVNMNKKELLKKYKVDIK